MGERRQKNPERSGIDHFSARVRLADLVAHNDSGPRRYSSDCPHCVGPRQMERSSLYEHGDHGARPPNFLEPG